MALYPCRNPSVQTVPGHFVFLKKGQFTPKNQKYIFYSLTCSAIYSSRLFWGDFSFGDISSRAFCLFLNIIELDWTASCIIESRFLALLLSFGAKSTTRKGGRGQTSLQPISPNHGNSQQNHYRYEEKSIFFILDFRWWILLLFQLLLVTCLSFSWMLSCALVWGSPILTNIRLILVLF